MLPVKRERDQYLKKYAQQEKKKRKKMNKITNPEILVAFQTNAESCRFEHVTVFATTSFRINV